MIRQRMTFGLAVTYGFLGAIVCAAVAAFMTGDVESMGVCALCGFVTITLVMWLVP